MWLHGAEKHHAAQLETAGCSYSPTAVVAAAWSSFFPTMEAGSCSAGFLQQGKISTIKGAVPSAETRENSASTELLPLSALN
jgi:hypothetical protein